MKKRIIPIALSIIIVFQCIGTTLAAEMVTNSMIAAEIRDAKDEMYETIYSQLESQGALAYLSAYEEVLYPRVERGVLARYGRTNATTENSLYAANITRNAPYGGVVTYTLDKIVPIKCVETFLDANDGAAYLVAKDDTYKFTLETIIAVALGAVKPYGTAFSILLGVMMVLGREGKNSIKNAGNCADILVMQQGNLDPSYLIVGWTHHPQIILWRDNISSYEFDIWSKH